MKLGYFEGSFKMNTRVAIVIIVVVDCNKILSLIGTDVLDIKCLIHANSCLNNIMDSDNPEKGMLKYYKANIKLKENVIF